MVQAVKTAACREGEMLLSRAVLLAMLMAPYRTAGKPATSMPWANQMKLPSLTGDQTIRPSSGSRVAVVPGLGAWIE